MATYPVEQPKSAVSGIVGSLSDWLEGVRYPSVDMSWIDFTQHRSLVAVSAQCLGIRVRWNKRNISSSLKQIRTEGQILGVQAIRIADGIALAAVLACGLNDQRLALLDAYWKHHRGPVFSCTQWPDVATAGVFDPNTLPQLWIATSEYAATPSKFGCRRYTSPVSRLATSLLTGYVSPMRHRDT